MLPPQLPSSSGLGCLIFFDDYSSILIVGNSLKPLLQSISVSAEKFALLVHTMGVALASFTPVSSWVVSWVVLL
jgi:Na+/H+ antiporter NhaC